MPDDEIEKELEKQSSPNADKPALEKIENQESRKKRRALEESNLTDENIGWKPLPKDALPSEGKFYSEERRIRVKPASFEVIKTYSMMDEEDQESVDNGVNEIISEGCKVGGGDYRDLTITDKLHVFFSIRDFTMLNTKSKNEVTMKFVSRKTGEEKILDVNAKMFEYYDIKEGLMKHYDKDAGCFIIKGEGMDKSINVFVPTVGTVEIIKKYISHIRSKMKFDNSAYLDKDFVVYAQYMIADWRDVDDEFVYLDKLREDFKGFTPDELQIFTHAVGLLKVGIKPTIKVKFEKGDVEVFPMTFRKYKSLFFVSDKIGRLFGDD